MDFTPLQKFMDFMARERTPGNAVEVYLDGKSVFRYHCGYSNLEKKIPLTGTELYNIYSCSKVTTVVSALQLIEQGKCKLDDPLYAYIPEFQHIYVQTADGHLENAVRPITLRHLFTMTAGFNHNVGASGILRARSLTNGNMDTLTVIRSLAGDPLSFHPGDHWQYGLCHDVLAAVVEVVSGKKFHSYVQDAIFDPLEMVDSTYHCTEDTLSRVAEQYWFFPSEQPVENPAVLYLNENAKDGHFRNIGKRVWDFAFGPEYDSGGAGITTSVSDYAKLAAALANYGTGLTGAHILSPESIDLLRQNQLNETQMLDYNWEQLNGCGYGLGVRTHMDPQKSGVRSSIGEFGWGGAAGSTVIIDPKYNLGVFYAQHTLNPREEYYQPRLRDVVYQCF